MNTTRAQRLPILVETLYRRSGSLAPPGYVRGWLRLHLAALCLIGALFMVVGLPTSVTFSIVRDAVPTGRGVYLHRSAHQSPERLDQTKNVGGDSSSPVTHRTRGVVDVKTSTDNILASFAPVEDYRFLTEDTQATPKPDFIEPRPTDHSSPYELLGRPPPVR